MAAYRSNRRMRGELLACMRRWGLSLGVAAPLTAGFRAPGDGAAESPRISGYLAATGATFIAYGLCVLFLTGCV